MKNSKSQLDQDLWVLEKTNNKRNGFFIEAGACDGIFLSNTYLLEKEYNWNGICCEPSKNYHKDLRKNRDCNISHLLLYDESGETKEFHDAGEFSGVKESLNEKDELYRAILSQSHYLVETISLNNLLDKYGSPRNIDYISLDTEGSERRILSTFDFNKWDVFSWSIEHNTARRYDGGAYLDELILFMRERGYEHELNKWDVYFFKAD